MIFFQNNAIYSGTEVWRTQFIVVNLSDGSFYQTPLDLAFSRGDFKEISENGKNTIVFFGYQLTHPPTDGYLVGFQFDSINIPQGITVHVKTLTIRQLRYKRLCQGGLKFYQGLNSRKFVFLSNCPSDIPNAPSEPQVYEFRFASVDSALIVTNTLAYKLPVEYPNIDFCLTRNRTVIWGFNKNAPELTRMISIEQLEENGRNINIYHHDFGKLLNNFIINSADCHPETDTIMATISSVSDPEPSPSRSAKNDPTILKKYLA